MAELEGDPDAYLEVDVDFHSELAAATRNVVLAFVLDSVRELLRVSRRVTNLNGKIPEATKEHRRIYEALASREPETAPQSMGAHLLTVTEFWARAAPIWRSRPSSTTTTERSYAGSAETGHDHRRAAERGGHRHRRCQGP